MWEERAERRGKKRGGREGKERKGKGSSLYGHVRAQKVFVEPWIKSWNLICRTYE